jgi:beta-phosphoglucomutase-like phosphatase (HAD superfamily)
MKKKLIIFDLDGVLVDSMGLVNDFLRASYPTMT